MLAILREEEEEEEIEAEEKNVFTSKTRVHRPG